MKKFFLYLKYYFEPKDAYVRGLAYTAAKEYFNVPLRNRSNPAPRISEYDVRRQQFLAYQRSWNDSYRHNYAKSKLAEIWKKFFVGFCGL